MLARLFDRLQEDKTSIGAALTITGIPLGMYLDFFMKIWINWTILFMALSLFLLFDRRNIFRKEVELYSPVLSWIFAFQILMITYGMMSENMTFQFLSYHLYILGLLFAYLSITDFKKIDRIAQWIFITSIPSVLFGVLCCLIGIADGAGAELYKQTFGEDAYNLDTLTISSAALNAFFSIICFPTYDKRWKWWFICTIIFGGYVLLACGKRTPILILLIGIMVFSYIKGYRLNLSPKNIRRILAALCVLVASYFCVDFVHERVDSFAISLYEGLRGLFVSDIRPSDIPLSVYERLQTRDWAIDYIMNDFKWYNYIFGGGYFLKWIDYPVLQAYLDLGILGTVLFLLIVVFYPMRLILAKINDNSVILVALLALYPMFSIISSGTPYHPNNYVVVLLLAVSYQRYYSSCNEQKEGVLDI